MKKIWLLTSALIATQTFAQSDEFKEVETLAIEALNGLQERSIQDEVEYCGNIVEIDGKIQVSEIVKGNHDSCLPPEFPQDGYLLADFHTHGNHNPDYAK